LGVSPREEECLTQYEKSSIFKLILYNEHRKTLGYLLKKLFALFVTLLLFSACSSLPSFSNKPNATAQKQIQFANILNNKGVDAYKKGDLQTSLKYYLQSLALKEKYLGVNSLNTATSYNNIGLIYKKMRQHKKALFYLTKALKVRERVLGIRDSQTAESYNNIGTLYAAMGNTENAVKLTKNTIEIKENIIQKEKIDIAISYTNLAVLKELQGESETAINWHKKALEINQEIFGEAHIVTQNNYKNIAQLYFATQQYEKAKEYARHIRKEETTQLEDIEVSESAQQQWH